MPPFRNEQIRDFNSKLLLETIIRNGPVSRASLAKQTGLTKATVSAIVQDLLLSRLVTEIGSEDTVLGRKPILLSFNRKTGYAISIDIGPAAVSALAADLLGEALLIKQIITPEPFLLISALTGLISSIQGILSRELPEASCGLCGITLGIHGVTRNQQIIFTPHYHLEELPLAAELHKFFSVPVFLENEANLAVIGERAFLPPSVNNIVDISIHSGVGVGLFLNGSLFTGAAGYAGEFGHTIIERDGRPCSCGSRGCLEQYLSEPALLSDYALLSGQDCTDFSLFAAALKAKEPAAAAAAGNYMDILCLCINNIVHTYNPELIIITSSLLAEFPEFLQELAGRCVPPSGGFTIISSRLKEQASLYGGIHQAVLHFLGIRKLSFASAFTEA